MHWQHLHGQQLPPPRLKHSSQEFADQYYEHRSGNSRYCHSFVSTGLIKVPEVDRRHATLKANGLSTCHCTQLLLSFASSGRDLVVAHDIGLEHLPQQETAVKPSKSTEGLHLIEALLESLQACRRPEESLLHCTKGERSVAARPKAVRKTSSASPPGGTGMYLVQALIDC